MKNIAVLEKWNQSFTTLLESQKIKALMLLDNKIFPEGEQNENEDIKFESLDFLMSFRLKSGTTDKDGLTNIEFTTNLGTTNFVGIIEGTTPWQWTTSVQSLNHFFALDESFLQEVFKTYAFHDFVQETSKRKKITSPIIEEEVKNYEQLSFNVFEQ